MGLTENRLLHLDNWIEDGKQIDADIELMVNYQLTCDLWPNINLLNNLWLDVASFTVKGRMVPSVKVKALHYHFGYSADDHLGLW